MKKTILKKYKKIILLGILLLLGIIYLLQPNVKKTVNEAIQVLTTSGIDGVIQYIRGFGIYAGIVSFILMILQSVISPIPAFLITLSNAAIFGWIKGAILSWTSSMVGALLCFYIARILGRDVVVKLMGSHRLKSMDSFFEKYGKFAILVARLLPFVSFDLVSYAAGLTSMNTLSFLIATGLGQLPATIVYSYVGGVLEGGAQKLMIGLLILFSLSIIIYVMRKLYEEREKKKVR